MNPEQQARAEIDRLLGLAGWAVQSVDTVNLHAARGVAIREFPLNTGFGFADYLLYVDGKACGVVEAKKQGATLTGVEIQSARYAQGLPGPCDPDAGAPLRRDRQCRRPAVPGGASARDRCSAQTVRGGGLA